MQRAHIRRRSSRFRQRRLGVLERLEQRALLAAIPFGALPTDTGEFLLGTVAVTPVLFESNGQIDTQTQDWTAAEIDATLAKVTEGVNWWSDALDALGTVHNLDFVVDETFARDPFGTAYEPIDRPSTDASRWVGEFLADQGYADAGLLTDAVLQFNQSQREKFGTDWSFTIFIVDSSDDADGLFAASNSFAAAFAYAGGLFIVTPSTRPASTIAHEMGHIFWARDEYPGGGTWSDYRGYYNTQNLNAWDNPTPGFEQEISIMRGGIPLSQAYQALVSPESTLAMVGWQDSDGDGVFDLADVPLHLEGIGYFDSEALTYHFKGEASAVPLINQNSSGNQSDITLNRVSELQYRIDSGVWQTAATPDQTEVNFDLMISLTESFNQIEWRVIDLATGIVSPSMLGTNLLPATPGTGVTGVTFLDDNQNGTRELGEVLLANSLVMVKKNDGSPLFSGQLIAQDLPSGLVSNFGTGVTLQAAGDLYGTDVSVFDSTFVPSTKTFHAFDLQRNRWTDRWSDSVKLQMAMNEPVGEVTVQMFGYQGISYGRIEAYDALGNLVKRVTSDGILENEEVSLRIVSEQGDISIVRVYGYAGTSIGVGGVQFGNSGETTTDAAGNWRLPHLPAGEYRVEHQAEKVIHGFVNAFESFQVTNDDVLVISSAAEIVDSPMHNLLLAEDVNNDQIVTALDALLVINDLSRYSPRWLTADDPTELFVDVNNDGAVSALDALVVINALAQGSGASGESESRFWLGRADGTGLTQNSGGVQMTRVAMLGGSAGGCISVALIDSAVSDLGNESVGRETADDNEKQSFGVWINGWKKLTGYFIGPRGLTHEKSDISGIKTAVRPELMLGSELSGMDFWEPITVDWF